MKYPFYILLVLASCTAKKKADPLLGKWEYEKIELYSGEPVNLQDSIFNLLHTQQTGLTFYFEKNNIFKVTQKKPDNTETPMAEQPYELPEDKKTLRLKNRGQEDDNFPIISMSDSILKINIFYSKVGYLVFRKKE